MIGLEYIYKTTKPEESNQILNGLTSYWSDRAHSYSAQNIAEMNDWRREAWRRLILENAPDKEQLRILDVGTGPGFFAINLALAGHIVSAVDVTEHMIWHARDNAAAYGADVDFVLHRGEFLPFEDESFDLIVSRNVIWNLEFPEKALSEWSRVLVPGGRMVYFDANWYLYLYDEELKRKRQEHRAAFQKKHPGSSGGGDLSPERVQDLENIAYSLPLSRCVRPQWDVKVLEGCGMKIVRTVENVGEFVQNPEELQRDSVTPVFMVCAQKKAV